MGKRKLIFAACGALIASQGIAIAGNPKDKELEKYGECHGINSCKGQGACGGKGTTCAGTNDCKAQGWLTMTKEQCEKNKGTFKK